MLPLQLKLRRIEHKASSLALPGDTSPLSRSNIGSPTVRQSTQSRSQEERQREELDQVFRRFAECSYSSYQQLRKASHLISVGVCKFMRLFREKKPSLYVGTCLQRWGLWRGPYRIFVGTVPFPSWKFKITYVIRVHVRTCVRARTPVQCSTYVRTCTRTRAQERGARSIPCTETYWKR